MRIYLFLVTTVFIKNPLPFLAEDFYYLTIYGVLACYCLAGG